MNPANTNSYRIAVDLAAEATSSKITRVDMETILAEDVFVIVSYKNERFPGQVTGLLPNGRAIVEIRHRCVGGWFWPSQSDEIDYKSGDIIKNDISYPVPVNRKGLIFLLRNLLLVNFYYLAK